MSRKRKCPTPWKVAHPNKIKAFAHMFSLRRKNGSIDERPYRCRCGAWHVGNRYAPRRR